MTKKMVGPGSGGGDFALGSAAGRIGSGGNLGFGGGGSGKAIKPKKVKKPRAKPKFGYTVWSVKDRQYRETGEAKVKHGNKTIKTFKTIQEAHDYVKGKGPEPMKDKY